MSELSEIHVKINRVSDQLAHLNGWLEGMLPQLATKEDITQRIAIQRQSCRRSMAPQSRNGKMTAVIIGAIGALTATVIALTQLL